MDLLMLSGLVIVFGLIFICMGLAFINQSLEPTAYNNEWGWQNTAEYYENPLHTLNSKWFHYRPKGSVVLTKAKWDKIEKNIGVKVNEARNKGKVLGRKEMMVEIEDTLREEKAKCAPSSPYELLGVKPSAAMDVIENKYRFLLDLYNPANFAEFDKSFVDLAKIRTDQLKKAWQLINTGVGTRLSDGNIK